MLLHTTMACERATCTDGGRVKALGPQHERRAAPHCAGPVAWIRFIVYYTLCTIVYIIYRGNSPEGAKFERLGDWEGGDDGGSGRCATPQHPPQCLPRRPQRRHALHGTRLGESGKLGGEGRLARSADAALRVRCGVQGDAGTRDGTAGS